MSPKPFRVLAGAAALLAAALQPALAGMEEAIKALQAGDFPTVEKELQLLVKERDPRAQTILAVYVYGNPDSKMLDFEKGSPLLLDAAERGYVNAMLPLAGAYVEGKGFPRNMVEGYKWLLLAERWNALGATQLREAVARDMKPEEIEKARTAADAFTFKTK